MASHQQLIDEYIGIIKSAYQNSQPLNIIGGNSKPFLGNDIDGKPLEVSQLSGIIDYEPTELYIKAFTGTPLTEIESILDDSNQMFAFEPPNFNQVSTIGGVVATGLSGSRRPFYGSARDYVLGLRCINGKAEDLSFGGEVIKNVAGYDVSRLMTGAYGTLGLLLEVSLRVVPKPEYTTSISLECSYSESMDRINEWIMQSIPITAVVFYNNQLNVRLAGKKVFIEKFLNNLNFKFTELENIFWQNLNNHELEFFQEKKINIWRLSVPSNTPCINLEGEWLIDWAGAQRWFKTSLHSDQIREVVDSFGGHASLYYGTEKNIEPFHPLPEALKVIHRNIKHAFDPRRIINPGKMYTEL